jgi:hypothetical protein
MPNTRLVTPAGPGQRPIAGSGDHHSTCYFLRETRRDPTRARDSRGGSRGPASIRSTPPSAAGSAAPSMAACPPSPPASRLVAGPARPGGTGPILAASPASPARRRPGSLPGGRIAPRPARPGGSADPNESSLSTVTARSPIPSSHPAPPSRRRRPKVAPGSTSVANPTSHAQALPRNDRTVPRRRPRGGRPVTSPAQPFASQRCPGGVPRRADRAMTASRRWPLEENGELSGDRRTTESGLPEAVESGMTPQPRALRPRPARLTPGPGAPASRSGPAA